MILPKKYAAKVLSKEEVSTKTTRLTLVYIDPPTMTFVPGQFINLKCGDVNYRSYSIASDYKDENKLSLLVETLHEGCGSNFVRALKINETVEFIGPSGRLSLNEPLPQKIYFFATGTGIAPFIAMFFRLVDINYKGKARVFVGFRREAESLELDRLQDFSNRLLDFSYVTYYSQPDDREGHNFRIGYITQEISSNIDQTARYFACGHPAMVNEVKTRLIGLGVLPENIVTEGFTRGK